jgi:hypothetical protein
LSNNGLATISTSALIRLGPFMITGSATFALFTPLDPILILTRTQYPAVVGNAGNTKPFVYAGFASVCNAQQPLTAHS